MGEPREPDPLTKLKASIIHQRIELDLAKGMAPSAIEEDLRHLTRALNAMHRSMIEQIAQEAEVGATAL